MGQGAPHGWPNITRRGFARGAGAALVAGIAPGILRAQAGPLKIGAILPRSGTQAFFGQSCQKGLEIAPALLKELGYDFPMDIVTADSETNVDVARSQAERLINDGANVLTGAFDSGGTAAIAQVCEQRGVPFVINIAAAPQITEQGYKFVFRNFPTSLDLVRNGLLGFKDVFAATGTTPKTAVFMHVNDTFGQANKAAVDRLFPAADMPFRIVETISYDPAAKDLSVEVAKAKATGADLLMVTSRINDAILLVREMVRQRWSPMGIMSPGSPGMYEEQFFKTLGKYADYEITVIPWYNPNSDVAKRVAELFGQTFPKDRLIGNIFNVGFTVEAVLILADAYKRAGSTDGRAVADALRRTDLAKRVMIGPPIQFDEKGQVKESRAAVLQNFNSEPKVVLPREAAQAKPVFPMPAWDKR